MSTGETLLKLSDYPFAYSFTALMVGTLGLDIQNTHQIIFLAAAGTLGTFLAVTDPLGRLSKYILKKMIQRRKTDSQNEILKNKQSIRAIYSRSIGVEVDKLTSLVYFVVILYLFSSFMNTNPSFAEQFQLVQKDGHVLCATSCIQEVGNVVGFLGALAVIGVGVLNCRELKKQIEIAGTHQLGISSEFVINTTIENMSKAIQENDWKTAEEWGKIVENEIKTEKGRKDFNLEAVKEVYRPLYEESIQNQAAAANILQNNVNTTFSATMWNGISSTTKNLLIKDKALLEKINTLYQKIDEYNKNPPTLENRVKQIIQREATKFYGMSVDDIHYWFKHGNGGSSPGLWDCLRSGQHPTQRFNGFYNYRYIELDLFGGKHQELKEENSLADFDRLWKILLERVNSEIDLTKLREQVLEIQKLNNDLKPAFEEYIKKQWL